MLQTSFALAATLRSLDIKESSANKVVLSLSFSSHFSVKGLTLKKPPREVLDFAHSQPAADFKEPSFSNALIRGLRFGADRQGTLRIVIDLTSKTHEIDIQNISKHTLQITIEKQRVVKAVSYEYKREELNRDVVVVLDPGHGGKDAGATGAKGTKEKEVVLQIAKVLAADINRQPGMKAYLTRNKDYYIPLRKRLDIAREKNADLFISIHADAFNNSNSRGASVFALSEKGATSEAARWLAEKENYSELGGVDLGKLHDASGVVRSVLIDLSQTVTIRSSLLLGKMVLDKLDELTVLHHEKVEQARFVVLKSPDIPSILVETGFITNAKEERNLKSSWYHKKLSRALVRGIHAYFRHNRPANTRFARAKEIYRVKKGDTLSEIAARHGVTLKKLLKNNHLKMSSHIQVGQRLKLS